MYSALQCVPLYVPHAHFAIESETVQISQALPCFSLVSFSSMVAPPRVQVRNLKTKSFSYLFRPVYSFRQVVSNLWEHSSPSKQMSSPPINAPTQTRQQFALCPRLQLPGWHWTWEEELMLRGWRSAAEKIAVEKVSETFKSGSLVRCLHQVLLWCFSD